MHQGNLLLSQLVNNLMQQKIQELEEEKQLQCRMLWQNNCQRKGDSNSSYLGMQKEDNQVEKV
jgi:hypothetical protein